MDKQYDIEKISENLNRERKMNSDFNDDDDLGMDFFAHLEEIQKRMNENDISMTNNLPNHDKTMTKLKKSYYTYYKQRMGET